MADFPFLPWYVADDLSDPLVAGMTNEQFGALMRLRGLLWRSEGAGLEDDDEMLARLSGMGQGWFNGGSTVVRKYLVPHPEKPGFLTTESELREWGKVVRWKEKSAEGGRKSAAAKKKQSGKGGSTTVPTKRQPNVNSSPSPSPIKKPPPTSPLDGPPDGWREVEEELVRLGSGAADAVVRDARKSGWSPERAAALLAHWQTHRVVEGWGIGLAAHALARPPRPPAECLTLVRTAKPVDTRGEHAALQAFELKRQDEIRRKATEEADRRMAERLEQFGAEIDAMSIEERQELLAEGWERKEANERGSDWRESRLLKHALLLAIERSQTAEAAA